MLDRIFNADNAVFRFFTTVGYIWWLHILWLVCSLPVITIGASTTALCYSCMKLHKQEGYVTENFFHSFKENFRQSTIIFLIFLFTGVILLADIIFCEQLDVFMGDLLKLGAIVLFVVYFITLLYVFAVQARFCNPVKKTIQYAFVLGSRHFSHTICMLVIVAAVVILNLTIVLANYITISIGIGFVVYIMAGYYNKIMERYIK